MKGREGQNVVVRMSGRTWEDEENITSQSNMADQTGCVLSGGRVDVETICLGRQSVKYSVCTVSTNSNPPVFSRIGNRKTAAAVSVRFVCMRAHVLLS